MLAPGDYLTTPAQQEQRRETAAPPPQPPAPAPGADEPRSESFLMKLLRALGAVHT
jgi:hypothetical protein